VAELAAFREASLGCFTRRADASFELTDAVLAAGPVPSLPHLSLDPPHRRGHGSTYAAPAQGRIDTEAVRDLLAAQHTAVAPVFAIDVSCRPRCHDLVPLFVFDGGYDPVRLALALAGARAQLLVRIRSDRCFRLKREYGLHPSPRGGISILHCLPRRAQPTGDITGPAFGAGTKA
jgi:hypothetical protein